MRPVLASATAAVVIGTVVTIAPLSASAYTIDRVGENCTVTLTDREEQMLEITSPIELTPAQVPAFQYDLQSQNRRLQMGDTTDIPQWAVDLVEEAVKVRERLAKDVNDCVKPVTAKPDPNKSDAKPSDVLAVLGIVGGVVSIIAALVAVASVNGLLPPLV